jgi:hypothetical protein
MHVFRWLCRIIALVSITSTNELREKEKCK